MYEVICMKLYEVTRSYTDFGLSERLLGSTAITKLDRSKLELPVPDCVCCDKDCKREIKTNFIEILRH